MPWWQFFYQVEEEVESESAEEQEGGEQTPDLLKNKYVVTLVHLRVK